MNLRQNVLAIFTDLDPIITHTFNNTLVFQIVVIYAIVRTAAINIGILQKASRYF